MYAELSSVVSTMRHGLLYQSGSMSPWWLSVCLIEGSVNYCRFLIYSIIWPAYTAGVDITRAVLHLYNYHLTTRVLWGLAQITALARVEGCSPRGATHNLPNRPPARYSTSRQSPFSGFQISAQAPASVQRLVFKPRSCFFEPVLGLQVYYAKNRWNLCFSAIHEVSIKHNY